MDAMTTRPRHLPLQLVTYCHHYLISAFKKLCYSKILFSYTSSFSDEVKTIVILKAMDPVFLPEILCLQGAQVLNVFTDIFSIIHEQFPEENTGPLGPALS